MSEVNNPLSVGNSALLNFVEDRFLVKILGTEDNKIWVSFPGNGYPVDGMGGRLEFHRSAGFSAYNVQVLRYAEGQSTGLILERSESAEQRTHRTAWRVPADFHTVVQKHEDQSSFTAVMEDLSAEGALIRAHPMLDLHTPLRLTFALDREHGDRVVDGDVCYTKGPDPIEENPMPRYGVRFRKMTPETRRLLTLFLYHHVRKLYPKDVAAMYPARRRRR